MFLLIVLSWPLAAAAQVCSATPQAECLCDPQNEDCRSRLINLIRNETVGIDVAFWFMEDARYTTELINKHNQGVPVRVLVDQRANASKRLNETMLNTLRDGGIPMRDKYRADILHHKFMLFQGQNFVEFSKANYTGISFVPVTPNVNYFDEVIFFSNDSNITNSFRRRFEDNWNNTTNFRDLYNMTDPLLAQAQSCPTCTIHSSMNFVPLQNFATRMISRVDRETQAIDAVVYRVTYHGQADAMVRAVSRGVPVRLITETEEYRNPARLWVSKHLDRMYMGGVQMKVRQHQGLLHQGSIVLRGLGEVIFGSANWTTASNQYQDEHNYFYSPSLGKPWFYNFFADQFDGKWNDTTNYVPFRPLPPGSPAYSLPVNGAGSVSSSTTLTWDGGNWSHLYDIYFGTTPNPPLFATNQELGSPETGVLEKFTVSNLQPGTTYYWRIVDKTWAMLENSGPVWSFTTAGGTVGGGSTPFTGTPAAIPGTIQAENFDNGGQGIAWSDSTAGNSYGAYRSTDVDIEATSDSGGAYDIAKTKAGEWVNYSVDVATSGTYTLETRVANVGTGASFRVFVDGVDVAGAVSVPDTGGWQTWTTKTGPSFALSAGQHVVRVYFATVGSGGGVGNFNWFAFSQGNAPANTYTGTPFRGTAAALPGRFQAENFDDGGQNVSWRDTTTGNAYGLYRTTDVDIESTVGGGFDVAKTKAGEWLKYTVNVTASGTYRFQARVANVGTGATIRVYVDDADVTGAIAVPDTGGWQTWTTLVGPSVQLSGGEHVVRVFLATTGTGGGVGNFDWFEFIQ